MTINDSATAAPPKQDAQTGGNESKDPVEVFKLKAGLAQMLKGGVIMDVVNAEQVRTSE